MMLLLRKKEPLKEAGVQTMFVKAGYNDIELTEDEDAWLDMITSKVTCNDLTPEQQQYKEWAQPCNEIEALLFQLAAVLKSLETFDQFSAALNSKNLFQVPSTIQMR